MGNYRDSRIGLKDNFLKRNVTPEIRLRYSHHHHQQHENNNNDYLESVLHV